MRSLICAVLLLAWTAPAKAQDTFSEAAVSPAIEESFVEAAAEVCLATLLGAQEVAQTPEVMAHLRPASQETRAGHPFGRDETLWELASREDGQVTVRAPDSRTCSVFAVGASPAAAFEELAQVVLERGDFTELEIRRQHEGRVQRTFRSIDGRLQIELEGFVGGLDAFPNSGDLSMAHMGRRR